MLKSEPEVGMIRVRSTSKQEILDRFASVDVGWRSEGLFIGRWLMSNTADVGIDRLWMDRNLLVEFDEKQIVKRFKVCEDSNLIRQIALFLRSQDIWNGISKPVERDALRLRGGHYLSSRLVITKDSLELDDLTEAGHPSRVAQLECRQQFKLSGSRTRFNETAPLSPKYFDLTLQLPEEFDGGRQGGRPIYLRTDIPTLVFVVRCLDRSAAH